MVWALLLITPSLYFKEIAFIELEISQEYYTMCVKECFKNSRHNFGCFPVDANIPCVDINGVEEPFLNPLHLVADEITKSEVDVMVVCKREGKIGQLGKLICLKVGLGQSWFRVDTTNIEPAVMDYFRARAGKYADRPYFVSGHIDMLDPIFKVVVSSEDDYKDVVSYIVIEV